MAFGTSQNIIKIVSLKSRSIPGFTEFDIYQAHDQGIRLLSFVANLGILVSIDDSNVIRNWNIKDLREPPRECLIPNEKGAVASAIFSPSYLTNEPENEGFVFFGLSNGNVYIYNAIENYLTTVMVRFK